MSARRFSSTYRDGLPLSVAGGLVGAGNHRPNVEEATVVPVASTNELSWVSGRTSFRSKAHPTVTGLALSSVPRIEVGEPLATNNSGTSRLNFKHRGLSPKGWGVDKVDCSFPIAYFTDDFEVWGHHAHQDRRSTYEHRVRLTSIELVPSVFLQLRVYWVPSFRGYGANFEFNPSRLVDPWGTGLCSVQDLPHALGLAWDAVGEIVTPRVQLSVAKIRRLDVARDFLHIQDIAGYLTGWLQVPAPYSKRWTLEHDPQSGLPETLYKGTKNTRNGGLVRAYDKASEAPGRAQPGTLRVEVEAHSRWCRAHGGIERVEDLSEDSVLGLLRNRFEWAGCSSAVAGHSDFMNKAEQLRDKNDEPWSESRKDGFVGHQVRVAQGVAKKLPRQRKADYDRALQITGIPSLADLTGLGGNRPTVHLDFETGREVVDAAA